MNDKTRNFSDGRGDVTDLVHGLGDEHIDDVADRITRRGVMLLLNCEHCPRQCSAQLSWGEIAMMCLQQNFNPPLWHYTRQGVLVPIGCACGKMTRLTIDMDEIRRYKDAGVRSGCLDPKINQAIAAQYG